MLGFAGRYCGGATNDGGWSAWNGDPILLGGLAIVLAIGLRLPAERRTWALACWATLVVAFVSPVCALSAALFSARAVHHLLIVGVAAPLAAIAWPRRTAVGPVAALALSSAVLWTWHLPAAYDAALADKALYWIMQTSLLGSAWLFWSAVRIAAPAGAAAAVAGGAIQMGMLGALLSFAPRPLYESHLTTTVAYGLGPLADQQLGGLVMWVAGMIPYAVAAALLARGGWRSLAATDAPAARRTERTA